MVFPGEMRDQVETTRGLSPPEGAALLSLWLSGFLVGVGTERGRLASCIDPPGALDLPLLFSRRSSDSSAPVSVSLHS